jgi:hypothetical protein
MIKEVLLGINKFTERRRNVYLLGIFFAFLIALKEVLGLSYNNFQIFSYGSIDFWGGINPYSDWTHLSVRGRPLDNFLYGPLFSILFTPFTLLPDWLGVLFWNIFTYTLFFISVFSLPHQFDFAKKKFIFFYTIFLLFATLLSVQFNPIVAALFLFSFILFEKKQGFLAILLIFISGFTKVYGIFQIAMILFYPGFLRNTLYSFLIGIIFILIPLVNIPANELVGYYESWIVKVMDHSEALNRFSFFRPVVLFYNSIEPYMGYISLGVLFLILIFTLFRIKQFKESIIFRTQFLGIIMSWAILFSAGSERHTYVIAMVGYSIWYLCFIPTLFDKVLLWINFVLLGILPIDIFCPWVISNFILAKLNLGIIIFTITWLIMIYKTFTSHVKSQNLLQYHKK